MKPRYKLRHGKTCPLLDGVGVVIVRRGDYGLYFQRTTTPVCVPWGSVLAYRIISKESA